MNIPFPTFWEKKSNPLPTSRWFYSKYIVTQKNNFQISKKFKSFCKLRRPENQLDQEQAENGHQGEKTHLRPVGLCLNEEYI